MATSHEIKDPFGLEKVSSFYGPGNTICFLLISLAFYLDLFSWSYSYSRYLRSPTPVSRDSIDISTEAEKKTWEPKESIKPGSLGLNINFVLIYLYYLLVRDDAHQRMEELQEEGDGYDHSEFGALLVSAMMFGVANLIATCSIQWRLSTICGFSWVESLLHQDGKSKPRRESFIILILFALHMYTMLPMADDMNEGWFGPCPILSDTSSSLILDPTAGQHIQFNGLQREPSQASGDDIGCLRKHGAIVKMGLGIFLWLLLLIPNGALLALHGFITVPTFIWDASPRDKLKQWYINHLPRYLKSTATRENRMIFLFYSLVSCCYAAFSLWILYYEWMVFYQVTAGGHGIKFIWDLTQNGSKLFPGTPGSMMDQSQMSISICGLASVAFSGYNAFDVVVNRKPYSSFLQERLERAFGAKPSATFVSKAKSDV